MYEVICSVSNKTGKMVYARMEYKGRMQWKTKRIAEKHARDYRGNHLRDAWVSKV